MIRSMTGFGDASVEVNGVHYAVEIKTVNNRYFKSSIRLPDELGGLESELESLLRRRICRGSVMVSVNVCDNSASAAVRINEAALEAYLKTLATVQRTVSGSQIHIDLANMLELPGVVMTGQDDQLIERHRQAILELTDRACDRLSEMREREGAGLLEDLLHHREQIVGQLASVFDRAPIVTEEYHQRLRQRIDDLAKRARLTLAEPDLIKEVAVFAERCDISEETQRLQAHLDQFRTLIDRPDNDEPIGRTLDFLAQEMLREANTIASKSNDAEIARIIVSVKGAIDRIKEQVQNVE